VVIMMALKGVASNNNNNIKVKEVVPIGSSWKTLLLCEKEKKQKKKEKEKKMRSRGEEEMM
jgi:hypothetical protein